MIFIHPRRKQFSLSHTADQEVRQQCQVSWGLVIDGVGGSVLFALQNSAQTFMSRVFTKSQPTSASFYFVSSFLCWFIHSFLPSFLQTGSCGSQIDSKLALQQRMSWNSYLHLLNAGVTSMHCCTCFMQCQGSKLRDSCTFGRCLLAELHLQPLFVIYLDSVLFVLSSGHVGEFCTAL